MRIVSASTSAVFTTLFAILTAGAAELSAPPTAKRLEMSSADAGKAMHDAEVHRIKKRYREAEALLATVTDSEGPSDNRKADAYHMRGFCLSKLGDLEGAVSMARKSVGYKDSDGRRRMITRYQEQIRKRDEKKRNDATVILDPPIDPPTAKGRKHAMVVEIHADGTLTIDGAKSHLAAVTATAKKVAGKDAKASMALRVHRDVGVSEIKKVTKAAGAGGVIHVTFSTLKDK